MRVLHVFGDWKWTGPAEPTLDLCLELRARGVDARLLCPPAPPEASSNLPASARARGLEPLHGLRFNRKINLFDNLSDVALMQAIDEGRLTGPRIVPAAYALGATGGHCDETFLPPQYHRPSPGVAEIGRAHV